MRSFRVEKIKTSRKGHQTGADVLSRPDNPPIAPHAGSPLRQNVRRQVYILIFLNLLLFANTLSNRFSYDDMEYIVRNPVIQNPQNFLSLFTQSYPPHKPTLSLYRPLVSVSYMIDWCRSLHPSEFADLHFNDRVEMPFFHLTNIAFHIGAALALLFLARGLFKDGRIAFASALIFSVHPVHVENVASLVGRAESMCAMFYLLSLIFFLMGRERGMLFTPRLLISYLFFLAALLCKESAITLPVAILLTDWFLASRKGEGSPAGTRAIFLRNAMLRALPYAAVFLFYIVIRLHILGRIGIPRSGWYFVDETTLQRLAAMCVGMLTYLSLLIAPVAMSPDYNFPVRIWGPVWAWKPAGFLNVWALAGLGVIIIYTAFTLRSAERRKMEAYPLLFFPIALFPFSNIIPFGDFIAERFLYLPSVGYCLLVGILYARLREKERYEKLAITLLCLLISFYSVRTFLRNLDWRSGVTLWEAEMRQNPLNADRFSALGAEYAMGRSDHLVKGNIYREKGDFQKSAYHLELARDYEDRALKMLEQGIKEQPRDVMNLYNYGTLCVEMREPDLERAETFLLRGASYAAEAPQTLSFLYYCIAIINMKYKPPRADRALEFLGHAERIKPNDPMVLVEKAATLGKIGRYRDSLSVVRHALSRHPSNATAVMILKLLRERLSEGKTGEK